MSLPLLRLFAGLALAASLVAPAAALAADPSPPAGAWEIVSLEGPEGIVPAPGKLLIENGSLSASVGCNQLGAAISEITPSSITLGPVMSTKMACPEDLVTPENMLIAILSSGRLSFVEDAAGEQGFTGDAGRITVRYMGMVPPGPKVSAAPAESVASSAPGAEVGPEIGAPDPSAMAIDPLPPIVAGFALERCVGVLSDEELAPFLGRTSSGSAPAASALPAEGGGAPAVDGGPVPVASDLPLEVPPFDPGASAGSIPVDPLPPVEVMSPPLPDLAPDAVPTVEQCRALLASLRVAAEAVPMLLGAPAMAAADATAPKRANANDDEREELPVLPLALVTLAGVLGVLAIARYRLRRPRV